MSKSMMMIAAIALAAVPSALQSANAASAGDGRGIAIATVEIVQPAIVRQVGGPVTTDGLPRYQVRHGSDQILIEFE